MIQQETPINMSTPEICILNFYSFVTLENLDYLLGKLLFYGKKYNIKGTILIANEGFNGAISGTKAYCKLLLDQLTALSKAENIQINKTFSNLHPFSKLKVKIKSNIINIGVDLNVNRDRGKYLDYEEWNKLIARDDVVIIDTRNYYEFDQGTFQGAINPNTKAFRYLPNWINENKDLLKKKKIAMFCTGGVRCEKSTAYLRTLGYEEVYHLRGGIIKYLDDCKNENASCLWHGNCFVFDDRIIIANRFSF